MKWRNCQTLITFLDLEYFFLLSTLFTLRWILNRVIGLMSRVFANGPGDQGSILGQVIPKTQKWYLKPPCLTLSIIRHGSRIKWSNPGKGVASV